jgi:TolB-like protein
VLAGGLLFALGAGSWWLVRRSADADAPATGRLAVLPFENVGAAENDYFADGVADAVRGKLSSLPGLQVIASTSSDQYRRTSKSPPEIGRELGARYLLVGKVRWQKGTESSRVQVSPELIEASSGTTRWQQLFDGPLSDVFSVQEGITRGVASALELELGAGAREHMGERPTTNLAAYDAFLRGERLSNRVALTDAGALRNAIGAYESATALDTGFALAWAQLSRARSTLYVNGPRSPEDAEAARVAAERAIALSPALPQARFARALFLSAVRREHGKALEEVARGRRTAPRDPELLTMAALAEQQLGRWDEALAHFRQAYSLDPRSFGIRRRLARVLLWLRRYPEARAMADSALALSGASPDVLDKQGGHVPRRGGFRRRAGDAPQCPPGTRAEPSDRARRRVPQPLLGAGRGAAATVASARARSLRQRPRHVGVGLGADPRPQG